VRLVSRFLCVTGLGFLPLVAAEAHERLVMPFDCGVERGEVHLNPSVEKSYRIVGSRDEQTVTTCAKSSSTSCRTVMVHKFAVSCGGAPVAWVDIAAAIHSADANRAWLEGGQLNLVMPVRNLPEAAAACLDRPTAGGSGLERRVVLGGDCLPWRRKSAFEHLVLPSGFAPVGELGARLMVGAVADDAALSLDDADAFAFEPQPLLVSMTDAEMAVAKADPAAVLEPRGQPETFETALEPDAGGDDWITVVHSGPEFAAAAGIALPIETRPWAWLLVVASAGVVALLLAMRFVPPALARRSTQATSRALAKGGLSLANASIAVGALLQQTEAAARGLKGAGPLREVLESELGQVRQRLATIERSTAQGDVDADRAALQYRALVRELERCRRIVDSAVASVAGSKKGEASLPRTASEAYEVLGVNAEVSAGVLKKIVDALRMSWHPDHARDAEDRMLREDRIRQINIAWDLISANREAA
jgi:hypothetical protein